MLAYHTLTTCRPHDKADLLQGGPIVGQNRRVSAGSSGEAGGTVSTGCCRGVAGVLIRGGTGMTLGVLPAAVG